MTGVQTCALPICKKELIEARNEADSLAYNAEKTLKDLEDKVTAEEKGAVEEKIRSLREAMESDDVSRLNALKEELATAMHPIAQKLYAQAQEAQGGENVAPETEVVSDADDSGSTVDADFSESENK